MAGEPRRLLLMGLGLFDYMRDRFERLGDELVERGEERSEDIREFLDDLFETIPFLKKNGETVVEPEEFDEEEEPAGLKSLIADIDIKGAANDLLENLGLATGDDISEMKERIERLGRAIENS